MWAKLNQLPLFHLIRHKSIQNFIFLLLIQSSNILISLIAMPLLIQSLGVDQYGLISLALSVVLLANYFVDFGFSINGPREVALNQDSPAALSRIFSTILGGKLLSATTCTFIILFMIWGLGLFQEYPVILSFSLILLFAEAMFPLWFFQGMEKLKLVSLANLFSKLIFLLCIIWFIHSPEQARWVNFLMGGTALAVNLLVCGYAVFSFGLSLKNPRLRKVLASIKNNYSLFLSNVSAFIATKGGIILLSFYSVAEVLGMFSIAERPVMVLRIFPALVVQAIYPRASRLYYTDKRKFYHYVKLAYFYTSLTGLFISAAAFIGAPYIVKVLSKTTLPQATYFLQIMSLVPLLACLNVINVLIFLVKDQKKHLMNVSIGMCLFMLSTSLLLLTSIGDDGVAFAVMLSEAFVLLLSTFINWKKNKTTLYGLVKTRINSYYPG